MTNRGGKKRSQNPLDGPRHTSYAPMRTSPQVRSLCTSAYVLVTTGRGTVGVRDQGRLGFHTILPAGLGPASVQV